MGELSQESRIALNRVEELLAKRDEEIELLRKANWWLANKIVDRPTVSFRKCPPIMFSCPYAMVTHETCVKCWCKNAEEMFE